MASADAAAVEQPLKTPRAAGIAGLAFAVLFVASLALLRNHPTGGSTLAEIRDFYAGRRIRAGTRSSVSTSPRSPESPSCWFIAVVRNLIGDREDRFFSTVFLGSGLLFVAMLFIAAGVSGAMMAAVKFHDEPLPSPADRGDDPLARIRVPRSSTRCGWPLCS